MTASNNIIGFAFSIFAVGGFLALTILGFFIR